MNLQKIVQVYIAKIRPLANDELDWFKQQPTLREAVYLAAFAINRKGKRYKHQRRLRKVILEQAFDSFMMNEKRIEQCKDFDELHALLEGLLGPIKGIGELYVYDTALRIGARLGLLPRKVYLHAGTRTGARELGFNNRANTLEVSLLPKELQQLEPHEIEDVLCIFKDRLAKAQAQITEKEAIQRSRCS